MILCEGVRFKKMTRSLLERRFEDERGNIRVGIDFQ